MPDGQLLLWDYESDSLLGTWQAHDSELLSMVFLDEDTLATGGNDGMIQVWNIRNGKKVTSFESPNVQSIRLT
jgi:WD40 repeat protein